TPSSIIPVNSSEKEVTMEHSVLIESDLPTSWEIPLLNVELAPTSSKTRDPSLETWLPKDHSVRTELKLASGSSRKRIRSPSSPSYPDATTFSDGEPAASESPELNPKDLTARTYDNVDHVANNSDNEDVDEYITMEEGTKSGSQKSSNDQGASTPFEDCVCMFSSIGSGFLMRLLVLKTRALLLVGTMMMWIRPLWKGLCFHKNYINNRPWCLLGNFNASLYVDDTSIGPSTLDITMRKFKKCVKTMEVMDVQRTGLHFTWNQKPKGKNGILRKLDRILADLEFQDRFVGAHAIFKPYRISDHSPSVLYIPSIMKVKPNPFKFFNVSILDKRFKDVVRKGLSSHVSGFDMFRVVKKLKGLKKPIQKMMYDKGNLHANVIRLHKNLDGLQYDLDNNPSNLHANVIRLHKNLNGLQYDLDNNPSNASIHEEEAAAVVTFNEAVLIEEKFLKQKAKITWLREGDANTAYFHKMVRSRVSHSRIDVVTDVFLSHADTTNEFYTNNLFSTRLDANEALDMVRIVSSQEVKSAMFSMGNDKSPGLDGFTAAFFKDTWDIIGLA
nr:hypothetical protein [Tanacetum cinerariifolium]